MATIIGKKIQRDHSDGQGHCWRTDDDIPADIAEEIAAEIIDGKRESCDGYRATNGLYYRWK